MLHDSRSEDPSGIVTVFVTRDVLPGRERDYEEWTHRIIYDAVPFGSLGAAVITPEGNTPGRRIVVHRFANEEAQKSSRRRAGRCCSLPFWVPTLWSCCSRRLCCRGWRGDRCWRGRCCSRCWC